MKSGAPIVLALWACRSDDVSDDSTAPSDCDKRELYVDADADSYGGSETLLACDVGEGLVADGTDCDDADAAVHPGAKDVCDGRDDDCDGHDGVPQPWYADTDGDGFGDAAAETVDCAAPADFVGNAEDCDDNDAAIRPDAVDTCGDGIDSDCSGSDLSCGLFLGTYDLADSDAIVTDDVSSYTDAGRVLQSGDVTGDGVDDFLAGTLSAHGGYGGGWVVPGPVTGEVQIADAGFDLAGSADTAGAGRSIGLGDVNGDGIGDVAFGCPYSKALGQYILYGPVTGGASIAGAYDAAIVATTVGSFFSHGSDLADLDGDDIADSVIADWADSSSGEIQSGSLWVTFGPLTGDLSPDPGATIVGEHEAAVAGRIVHVDTDIDGDGLYDIVLNAVFDETGGPRAGAVYVVYGPADIRSLSDAAMLVGPAANAFAGTEFTSGDYDGDGYGEVAASAATPDAGGVYIARGPLPDETALSAADVILESGAGEVLGSGLASGDLSGDGQDDLLVGAPWKDNRAGGAYVVVDPASGTFAISDAAIATFEGDARGSYAGQAMAVGDLDDDGAGDLLVGAPGLSGVYVIYADP